METRKLDTLINSKVKVIFKEKDIDFFENTEDRNY